MRSCDTATRTVRGIEIQSEAQQAGENQTSLVILTERQVGKAAQRGCNMAVG